LIGAVRGREQPALHRAHRGLVESSTAAGLRDLDDLYAAEPIIWSARIDACFGAPPTRITRTGGGVEIRAPRSATSANSSGTWNPATASATDPRRPSGEGNGTGAHSTA
jgi:hypothetical protein